MRGTLLLISILTFASNSFAKDTSHEPINFRCGQRTTSGIAWKYCLHQYPNSSRKVLYYFHGILGSERDWKNHELERNIVRHWISQGHKPPVVVSISMGPAWLLIEKNKSHHSGSYEVFRDQIFPLIKNYILAFQSDEDWLMGVSMGGFNASQVYFKNPELFTRTALICPAMTDDSPYIGKYEFDNYIARTKAIPFLVWLAQIIIREHIPNPIDWPKHSPIRLAEVHLSPLSKPVYISNGTKDEFGFHEGNQIFAQLGATRRAPLQSHFYPGQGHCYVDPKPIADFFVQR